MQIEIPDFDSDTGPSQSFGNFGQQGGRDAFGGFGGTNTAAAALGFPTPSASSSRPFGGTGNAAFGGNPFQPSNAVTPEGSLINSEPLDTFSPRAAEARWKQNVPSSSGSTVSSTLSPHGRQPSINSLRGANRTIYGSLGGSELSVNSGIATPIASSTDARSRSNTAGTATYGQSNEGSVSLEVGSLSSLTGSYLQPAQVAVYIVMERFFEECENKIAHILGRPIPAGSEEDTYIPSHVGPGVDAGFDGVFESLASVSKRNPNSVINYVMKWKSRQTEGVDDASLQRAVAASGNNANARRFTNILSERKSLSLVYLLCRALISIVTVVSRESLGEELGARLEDIVFNSIKHSDPYATARNPNKQANMTMFAQLLGVLSNIRFTSVSDRAISEIDLMNRNALVRDQRDSEAKLGYLIKGVQYLKLKIYPLEAFEDTAEFISSFASIFDASRGSFVKTAMAETLGPLLSQVAHSATAEVNHLVWTRAITIIFTKAHSMSDKPSKVRYWAATVPLLCACIGAAPQDFLLARWTETVEWCFGRLKEKGTRHIMMMGVAQLVWTYLHRVREGSSALNKRLEPILKSAFPPDRKNAYPAEVSLDTFATILHYILHWQLDYGSEFLFRTLLTNSDAHESGVGLVNQVGPDRIMIAISASLRALSSLEKGTDPPYPSSDIQNGEQKQNTEDGADGFALDPDFLEKPRIKLFVETTGSRVLQIAAHCDRSLAPLTLTDDRWVTPWHDSVRQRGDASEQSVVRRHGAFAVEYPRERQQYFGVLQSCLQAWPRLLHTAAAESTALDILFRGLLSLDVGVAVESKFCLRRFLAGRKAFQVLQAFTQFIGRPELSFRLKPALQKASDVKLEALVKLWVEAMTSWCDQMRKASADEDTGTSLSDGMRLVGAIESTGLVLLCTRSASVRRSALDALRIAAGARTILNEKSATPLAPATNNTSVASLLDEAEAKFFDIVAGDDLGMQEKARLNRWRKQRRGEALSKLLEGENTADATLFFNALASIFATTLVQAPGLIHHTRSLLQGALQRMYPVAAEVAGIARAVASVNGTPHLDLSDERSLILIWTAYFISLATITTVSASKVGSISMGMDGTTLSSAARERITPGDELIRTLMPFLTSDQASFRDAAIRALTSIDATMYQGLLEGSSGLAQHLTSERKMLEAQKDRTLRPNTRIVKLFAAIGKLHESTTRFLSHPDFSPNDRTFEILLRFIKESCLFLRARTGSEDPIFTSIRKSFCIYSERILQRLGQLKEVHRYFHTDLLVDMFTLSEEWTLRSPGPDSPATRQSRANSTASSRAPVMKTRSSSVNSVSNTHELMLPAASLIACLCEYAVDVKPSSGSQRRAEGVRVRPTVSCSRLLRWVLGLFERNDPRGHNLARRALTGAIRTTSDTDGLIEATLHKCWGEGELLPLDQTLFGVFSGVLLGNTSTKVRLAAVTCLSIARIAHFDLHTRQRALDLLRQRVLSDGHSDWVPDIEAGIQSAFAGQHLVAQYQLCAAISKVQIAEAVDNVSEIAVRVTQLEPQRCRFLARLMPLWLSQIDLGPTVIDITSSRTRNLLTSVLLISSRLGDTQPDEMRAMWAELANVAHPLNTAAIITYLLDQTTRRANPAFVRLSRIILTCVAETSGAEAVTRDLLSSLHPASLLSTGAEGTASPELAIPSRAADIDTFYPQLPLRTVLSPMQASILLLGEAMVLRPTALGDRLVNLLHAYVVQADHTNAILRSQMRDALCRFTGMLRRMKAATNPIEELEDEWKTFWEFDEMNVSRRNRRPPSNMEQLVREMVELCGQILPDFCRKWSSVAIEWATLCPVRHVACRSLQVLRILAIPMEAGSAGKLLARLSNTASDSSPEIQVFALEVMQTLTASAQLSGSNQIPQLFWAGAACLESINEFEFQEAMELLRAMAEQSDDAATSQILNIRPIAWTSAARVVNLIVTKGLRAAPLCHSSWLLIRELLRMPGTCELVDWNESLPLLYAAMLPWCLETLDTGNMTQDMDDIALCVAEVAESAGLDGLVRVMTSFSKRRFRTSEDFLRQGVSAIRDYFLPHKGKDILTLFIGFLCNPLTWLRIRALSILRLYIRLIDPASPDIAELGYDLLTPLLNLLQTDVAQQALDILGEPLPVKGSAAARKGVRQDEVGSQVFGVPEDTGWCIANPQQSSTTTRQYLGEVIDTFGHAMTVTKGRPSMVEFASEWNHETENGADVQSQSDVADTNESFGDMVSALHDLSDFFGQDPSAPGSRISSPLNPSTARVAAIMSRSLSKRARNRASFHVRGGQTSARRPSSTFASSLVHRRSTLSVDSRDDFEEDDEEADSTQGASPTETSFTDDGHAFDLEDDYQYRASLMRRKSRPPDAVV